MPVTTTHPEYDDATCKWQKIRDCIAGKDAVIASGETYLPRLSEQNDDDYSAYQLRAEFFNATSRTLEGMVGILLRKQPTVVTTLENDPIMWDVDMGNTGLVEYARKVANDVCSVGRAGTLIDWSDTESRPYVAFYRAEDILNWQTARIDGRITLTKLVLRECIQEESSDEFDPNQVEQYRVLSLDYEGGVPRVMARVYREDKAPVSNRRSGRPGDDKTVFRISDVFELQRRGKPLTEIPFVFHGAEEGGPSVDKPPLYDIAEINLGHYRTSADLENGRHVCGVPTPYAVGFQADTKLYLGSAYAWTSEDTSASAGFIEFTGQGLAALERGLDEKTKQMESLGARILAHTAGGAEAYGTVALRNAAENSGVTKVADQLGDSITRVLGWLEWWKGTMDTIADTKAEFHIHKDYNAMPLTPEETTALTALWQQNAISYESLFERLQRGEVIPEGRTMEEEKALIEANPPMPPPRAAPTPPPGAEEQEAA